MTGRLRRPRPLVGRRAIAITRVDAYGGSVKIDGKEWSARAYLAGEVLEPGTRVEVVQVAGATALVY
jgi:membrane protein implicated in regulation of membrane protease activity